MLTRIFASTACAALLFSSAAVACPNSGSNGSGSASASTGASAAAKKHCKKGYHLVHKKCKRSHLQQQG